MTLPVTAPFLKWAGGKKKLLPELIRRLPPDVLAKRWVEPFVGGGAMFFALEPKRALLADSNQDLITTYCLVRDRVDPLIQELERIAQRHSDEHYYAVRDRFNRQPTRACGFSTLDIELAAIFIYLNKTCFNGLYRVNRQGEFNVPAGRYVNPRIVDAGGLRAASRVLFRARLSCVDFAKLASEVTPDDFVYFDPPYEPVSSTSMFTSYAREGFNADDQRRLRDLFAKLTRRGVQCMLSNSDAPLVLELYRDFQIDFVQASRSINSKAGKRGAVREVIVRNYTSG